MVIREISRRDQFGVSLDRSGTWVDTWWNIAVDRSDSKDVTERITNTSNLRLARRIRICLSAHSTKGERLESGVMPRSQTFIYYFFESSSSIVALKVAYGDAPTIFFTAFTLPSGII